MKHNHKETDDIQTILDIPKRTIRKMLERAKMGCSICGWAEAVCDIHHIVDISRGGSSQMSNLILVCPNHHRVIHTLRDINEIYSDTKLKDISLEVTFSNWKNFYNPRNKHDNKKQYAKCIAKDCDGVVKRRNSHYCSQDCFNKDTRLMNVTINQMKELLLKYNCNLSQIGRILGFSSNAIKKYCKRNSIEYKRIKYIRVKKERIKF